jgi:polar amino acid transport system substrate-binding protein
MLKKVSILILFCAVAVNTVPLKAETLTLVNNDWPPFIGKGLKNNGLAYDIVTTAFKKAGYNTKLVLVPWNRALNATMSGTYDILVTVWYTKERARKAYYSKAYLSNTIKFISKKGSSLKYVNFGDLKGLRIGLIRGYGYNEEFLALNNYSKDYANDLITNLKKLEAGRIDLTVEDELVAKYTINTQARSLKNKVTFLPKPLSVEDLYIIISTKNRNGRTIMEKFNQALNSMKSDGTYKRIMKSHGF